MRVVNEDIFGNFEPANILLWYDGPRIFTVKHNNNLFYCHQIDEDLTSRWLGFLAVEITSEELQDIKSNKIELYTLLTARAPIYFVKDWYGDRIQVYVIKREDIPEDCLPHKNIFLKPV